MSALNTSDRRVFGRENQLLCLYFQPHVTDLAAAFRLWLLIENCFFCCYDVLVRKTLFFPTEAQNFTQFQNKKTWSYNYWPAISATFGVAIWCQSKGVKQIQGFSKYLLSVGFKSQDIHISSSVKKTFSQQVLKFLWPGSKNCNKYLKN